MIKVSRCAHCCQSASGVRGGQAELVGVQCGDCADRTTGSAVGVIGACHCFAPFPHPQIKSL